MKNRANEENREMVLNNTVQIKHHSDELTKAAKEAKEIPAWVVAKVYEATTSMSNATHYLDGTTKMKQGGRLFSKRDLLFRFPNKTYSKVVDEGRITFTNKSKSKEKITFKEKRKGLYVIDRQGIGWSWKMVDGGMVERRYRILSPDGFDISFDKTYSIDEILPAFEEFKNRYKAQGYYSTSNRERINLDDLQDYCTLVEYDESEEEFGKGGGVKSDLNKITVYKTKFPTTTSLRNAVMSIDRDLFGEQRYNLNMREQSFREDNEGKFEIEVYVKDGMSYSKNLSSLKQILSKKLSNDFVVHEVKDKNPKLNLKVITLSKKSKMSKGGVIKNITEQLDELGVKYTLSKSKVRLFDEIIKPIGKDDIFYNKFDRIIDLYNLEGVVKTKMATGGGVGEIPTLFYTNNGKRYLIEDKEEAEYLKEKNPNWFSTAASMEFEPQLSNWFREFQKSKKYKSTFDGLQLWRAFRDYLQKENKLVIFDELYPPTKIPENLYEYRQKMRYFLRELNEAESSKKLKRYKEVLKEREDYFTNTRKSWYQELSKAEASGNLRRYEELKKLVYEAFFENGGKITKSGEIGSKLKEAAITAKNRLKIAYLRAKRYFENTNDKDRYKVIEKGDRHYNEIGIAMNGIEKDTKGKSFVTLTFKKGVNTYGIDEVEKIYETGGSMMTHGGNTKTGYINDRDSMYHGKNCFVCSHNGPEMMVEIMLKGKMKKIPLNAEKFEPIKTYEEGGSVKIVNQNIKFDKNRYKGIFGDFDKDGVVNIDDAFPTNKKRKARVEQIELAPIIEKLITLKNKLDGSMNSAVDELREKSPKSANIYARTKTPYSIIKKLIDKRLLDEKKGLTDLIGTTIAVDTYSELVDLKKKIENGLLGTVVSVDDFYSHPNAGYMAYHYIIKTEDGFLVEVQLKTKRMKSLNEISHEFYKKGNLNAENFLQLTKLTHFADMGDEEYIKKYNYLMKRKSLLRMLLTGEKKINLKSEKLIG